MFLNSPVSRLLRRAMILLAALGVLATAAPCGAATPAQIEEAINRAKKYLYDEQSKHPAGNWENAEQRQGIQHDIGGMQGDIFGGYTAIATYALLAAGDSPQDPSLAKAIRFLEKADVIGVYALGMRANVWALLPSARSKALCDRDARLLTFGMQVGQDNPAKGFWDYGNGRGTNPPSTRFDHSVSQYGVLGLWACAENDVPIDPSVWESIDAAWKAHQFPDGGWAYDSTPAQGREPSPAMTAAGVATLFITDEMIHTKRGIDCRGNIANLHIERGLQWITNHFKEVQNNYALYGIERIGAASGHKYFGNTDWFAAGADRIVKSQRPDGSWVGVRPDVGWYPGGENPIPTTAFALLFLVRGRAPVMMNKLQYDVNPEGLIEGNWNQRPRDVANITRWTGRQLEKHFNWQIVSLKAPVGDLLDAPILYISGDQDLHFTLEDERRLRDYVESGGMILANADCGKSKGTFVQSFEALGKRLFPRYEFRDLPANHLIFTDQQFAAKKWKGPHRLRGLSNGVRELMILAPDADPGRAWQLRTDANDLPLFQLGADIFLYAVDKQNLDNRGESYVIRPDENKIADHSARVARLVAGTNYDPEPGGWRRLAAMFHNQYNLDLDVVKVELGSNKIAGFKLAHLTGTGKFSLTPQARLQLQDYVQHDGTLVIDAAGGNAEFADSAVAELKAIFGPAAESALKDPLSSASPIFQLSDPPIGNVDYRALYRRQVVGSLKSPRLTGIVIGDRIAVFFSREDLTAGMVGEPVAGIAGYTPKSATDIMRNIILYSVLGKRAGGAAN